MRGCPVPEYNPPNMGESLVKSLLSIHVEHYCVGILDIVNRRTVVHTYFIDNMC